MVKVWNEEDNKFLRENYLKYSNQELAERFGVSKKSIQGKLRRLGLHRLNEDDAAITSVDSAASATIPIDEFKIRRRRLPIKIATASKSTQTAARYVPREMTERRKRAMRDFDSAFKLLSSGDTKKALEDFQFIVTNFKGENDIVERARMFHSLYSRTNPSALPPANSSEDWYKHGIFYSNSNKIPKAFECFEKALELEPGFVDAAYNIASIMATNGKFDESLEMLEHVLDMDERFVETVMTDDDFQGLWEDQRFLLLVRSYIEE